MPDRSIYWQTCFRQIRVWDDCGQSDLQVAHVALVGVSATGIEALKSLVLSGIGAVSIIDNRIADERDANANFYIDPTFIGQKVASVVADALIKLNDAVTISVIDKVCNIPSLF